MLGQLIRWLGARTLLALVLLAAMLVILSAGLNKVVRGLDLELALFHTMAGLLTGWLLARTPFPGSLAGVLTVILGIETVILRVGQLGGKILALLSALVEWMGQFLIAPQPVPDAGAVIRAGATLADALGALTSRSIDWTRVVFAGIPAFDPVAVAVVWSIALWLLAAWAGWATFRRLQPFAATFPLIIFLATWLAYSGANPTYLLPMVAAALVLIVSVHQTARERDWERRSIDAAQDLSLDVSLSAVPIIALLILAAALVPSFSLHDAMEFSAHLFEVPVSEVNRLPDSFGLEPAPRATTVFDAVSAPGLPRQHLIGAGAELSQRVVMTVQTDDPRARSYYWRSTTYDVYTGNGWATSESEIREYDAGQSANSGMPTDRPVVQVVQVQANLGGLLFAAGKVAGVDHDYRIAWRSPDDAFSASLRATSYRVESFVPAVTEEALRNAGSDYPSWVRERYLAPVHAPERVLALARDLTATARTPYDRTCAIESYLREFPYTLQVPAPPPNRDVVDYYLFDLKRGFCDYAASSMVVLARAAGLPARLVVGYASGSYDQEQDRYIVTEASAHSWVDVYFPSYGWIEFEPTGERAPLDRSAETNLPEPHVRTPVSPRLPVNGEVPNWALLVTGSVAAIALAGLGAWGVDSWRLRLLSPERRVGTVFARLTRWARRLRIPVNAAHTPAEAAMLIGEHARRDAGRRGKVLDRAMGGVMALTDLYSRASYSRHRAQAEDGEVALRLWSQIRWRMYLAFALQVASGLRRKSQ